MHLGRVYEKARTFLWLKLYTHKSFTTRSSAFPRTCSSPPVPWHLLPVSVYLLRKLVALVAVFARKHGVVVGTRLAVIAAIVKAESVSLL